MRYFPILDELFSSDSVIFLLAGLALAVIIAVSMKDKKKTLRAAVVSLAVYVLCEAVMNMHTNYIIGLLLLILGTAALGCFIGFLLALPVRGIKKRI